MMPIIYTPTVGEACQHFSNIYRRGRGLFISYPHRADMDGILQNAVRQNVKVIVVTDGERIWVWVIKELAVWASRLGNSHYILPVEG